jgi:thioredoxin reductase
MNVASELPVVIIGGGPVGLAAAAELVERSKQAIVFESGSSVGSSVLTWGHVGLFSPWRYCIDSAAKRMLEEAGWTAPDGETWPTGKDLVEQYLLPLYELPAIKRIVRLNTRVLSVTRKGFDKMKTIGREKVPFAVTVQRGDGTEEVVLASAVIDASGTYLKPNPLGSGGVPAVGERAASERISYRIPDVLGVDRARYANRKVAVVGSGHSAFNALLELVELRSDAPATEVLWVIRKGSLGSVFGGGETDELEARGALGARVKKLLDVGAMHLVTGFRTEAVHVTAEGVVLENERGEKLAEVDEVIATTGFRPDLSILSEVRLGLDTGVEAPNELAPLIDPNFHSCGTVRPHGEAELSHPEKDFYIVGMKSYGRAPTFLLLTGYEQVRSIACALTGDLEGAREVKLELPETGVCSRSSGEEGGCCDTAPIKAPTLSNGLTQIAFGPISRPQTLTVAKSTEEEQGASCCTGTSCGCN